MLGWALLADTVPLYPLYALLFADAGLSGAEISGLFAIWSTVSVLTEVPSGALADRFSRRSVLVAAGVLQAAGHAAWVVQPDFGGFALGFVLWGLGGAFASGAREALLYDGLAAVGAEEHYARVNGWVVAAGLVAEIPTAAAATALFATGGYDLVGWVSVGTCLAAAVVAARLPEPPRRTGGATDGDATDGAGDDAGGGATDGGAGEGDAGEGAGDGAVDGGVATEEPGYLATLRLGVREAARRPAVRAAAAAAALVGGFDAIEEYFPLITEARGVPVQLVPLAMLPIGLAGAIGAALGGRTNRLRAGALALLLGASMVLLGVASLTDRPIGLLAVAASYGGYRAVLVVVDARLQERIESGSRATVTSVAGLGVEAVTYAMYAAWALGELPFVVVLGGLIALALPWLLRVGRP